MLVNEYKMDVFIVSYPYIGSFDFNYKYISYKKKENFSRVHKNSDPDGELLMCDHPLGFQVVTLLAAAGSPICRWQSCRQPQRSLASN